MKIMFVSDKSLSECNPKLVDTPLLDTVVERFGTGRDVQYFAKGDQHFTVTADVKVTDQFFGWILGFGRKASILSPQNVVDQFTEYLDKIRSMYKEHADD